MHRNDQPLPRWADPDVPADSLDPQGLSRRGLLRSAGLFGAAFAAGSPARAPPRPRRTPRPRRRPRASPTWSATTTCTRSTATTRSTPSPSWRRRGAQYGLDWMVFTEHSNFGHAKAGGARPSTRRSSRPGPRTRAC